ncbi:MAG TPA: hypothetical protein VIL99_13175 [Ignavibacteria bacterium]
MGKILFTVSLFIILIFSFGEVNSQVRYTPPAVTLGASFDMNFATNDAYGRVTGLNSYNMRAGKGFSVFAKFGLGTMKRHRITTSIQYNKMLNYDANSSFFSQIFSGNPDDALHTNFNIWTGAVGYEYLFGAPCCNKQHLGLAVTFNSIGSVADKFTPTGKFENSFRVGLQFNAGYEFVLGQGGQYGLELGFKYNWINLFNPSNEINTPGAAEIHLNDGNGPGGLGFTRWIGMMTIDLGFNFYTGVKQVFRK